MIRGAARWVNAGKLDAGLKTGPGARQKEGGVTNTGLKAGQGVPEAGGWYTAGAYTRLVRRAQLETDLLKNITLSAEERLIEAARERARAEHTTLNEQFRRWLADYTGRKQRAAEAMAVIREL